MEKMLLELLVTDIVVSRAQRALNAAIADGKATEGDSLKPFILAVLNSLESWRALISDHLRNHE